MEHDHDKLAAQIEQLLADTANQNHPLYAGLMQLWRDYQELELRMARISQISDGYQSIVKQRELSLSKQLQKQVRQLDKIARISDRYQHIMSDLNAALKLASSQDELTRIPNRRNLLERLKQESERSGRHQTPLTLAMLDLDFFKNVNDAYGHDAGDLVLVETSRTMVAALRSHDIVGRWGGEEFLFVLPETDMAGAVILLERILASLRAINIQQDGYRLSLTASIGAAQQRPGEPYAETIKRADNALLTAKRSGRDQLCCADKDVARQ